MVSLSLPGLIQIYQLSHLPKIVIGRKIITQYSSEYEINDEFHSYVV